MSVVLTIQKKDIQDLVSRLDKIDIRKRDSAILRAFRQAGALTARKLQSNVTGSILHRRSGHLAQSIQSSVRQEGDNFIAEIGSGVQAGNRVPYADIHEDGAVITPKRAKYLTIPLEAALTPAGVPKKSSARAWLNTFVGHSKSGNLIIFQKKDTGGVVPLYLLVKSSTIPGRKYLSKTLTQMTGRILLAIRGSIERALNNEQA